MDQNIITLIVGLLAPVSTVAGVYIANKFNSIENQKRREFEDKDRENQRKFELTKDIFIKVAEDLVLINGHLAGMVFDASLRTKNEISTNFFANLNKLSLVASAKTSFVAQELSLHYAKIYTESLASFAEVVEMEAEVTALNQIVDKNQIELDRIQNKLKECVEKESPNVILFDNLIKTHDRTLDLQKGYSDQITEIYEKMAELKTNILKTVMANIEIVRPQIINLMQLIREEIGVENINIDVLEKSLEKNANDLINTLNSTVEILKS